MPDAGSPDTRPLQRMAVPTMPAAEPRAARARPGAGNAASRSRSGAARALPAKRRQPAAGAGQNFDDRRMYQAAPFRPNCTASYLKPLSVSSGFCLEGNTSKMFEPPTVSLVFSVKL